MDRTTRLSSARNQKRVQAVRIFSAQHHQECVRMNISFSQESFSLLPENEVPQELSEVTVGDDDIVEADIVPSPIDNLINALSFLRLGLLAMNLWQYIVCIALLHSLMLSLRQ